MEKGTLKGLPFQNVMQHLDDNGERTVDDVANGFVRMRILPDERFCAAACLGSVALARRFKASTNDEGPKSLSFKRKLCLVLRVLFPKIF